MNYSSAEVFVKAKCIKDMQIHDIPCIDQYHCLHAECKVNVGTCMYVCMMLSEELLCMYTTLRNTITYSEQCACTIE